jgi:type VI secretion system secreted protein VgrG
MLFKERKEFSFISKALSEDTFSVVKFRGVEAISRPYEFDITISSEDPEIDMKAVLQNPAKLTIKYGDVELPYYGILSRFEQLHEVKQHAFYRAVLVPTLWNACLYHENQLFLDKTVPEIIEEILKQAGLTGLDYELKLTRSYPNWEYICQYRETNLDFISRWMEREGMYYFFEQTEQGAKMVITDSSSAHQEIKGDTTIPYSPPSGLIPSEEGIIKEFVCRQRILPAKVILKDYNYRKPGLEVKAEAEVDPNGRGDVYIYGEHFKDSGQGNDLAKIRAEELLCREREFYGSATAPALSPGFNFELNGHYRNEYNRKYLIIEVTHEGSRAEDLLAGLGDKSGEDKGEASYKNNFVCIPADVQLRPERKTAKPKFFGTMNAVVDAAGDGKFAELDDQGRYKVILPIDLSGRSGGKASRYVRMAQPYSGFAATDGEKGPSGMHFPLHKGAEVLLTFVDGDPDRPIISSAVPNPETSSPVTSGNQTKSVVRDNYGNEIVLDSTPGDEHIRIYSPHHNSGMELGKSFSNWTTSDKGQFTAGINTSGVVGTSFQGLIGAGINLDIGNFWSFKGSQDFNIIAGGSHTWDFGYNYRYNKDAVITHSQTDILTRSKDDQILAAGDQICLLGGAKKGNTKSIVNLFPESISLSIGSEGEYLSSGRRSKTQWDQTYELYKEPPATFLLMANTLLSATFVSSMTAAIALKRNLSVYLGMVSAAAFVVSFATWRIIKYQLEAKKIEPVKHRNPAARIELKSNGRINMSSNNLIGIRSRRTIIIKSSRQNIKLDAANGSVQARGRINHPNFKVLA